MADTVRAVGGLQAQDAAAAALGIRARRPGSTLADVAAARFEERSVARTWVMRGTLHLIPAEDARWMVALLGPIGLKKSARRIASWGSATCAGTCGRRWPTARSPAASSPTPCGRAASASRITRRCRPGSPASPPSRARSSRGRTRSSSLIDDWLGPAGAAPEDPVVELARRHAHAHPPSAPEDFAVWSGLPMREARRAYESLELEEVEVLGRAAWVPRGLEPAPPHVRLLPMFDSYLLGHRDRSLILAPEHDKAVRPGGGILAATLVVDGMVEGTWKLERGRPAVTPFGDFDYADEVEDVVRFRATAR